MKSLLTFGQKTGHLVLNVGTPVRLPKIKQTLAEPILDEGAVLHMLTLERNPRNKAPLRLLYLGGLRIGEACALKVRDLQVSPDSGQITVFGKDGKTRVVLLKPSIWADLAMMRGNHPEAAVFRPCEGGGHLDPSQAIGSSKWQPSEPSCQRRFRLTGSGTPMSATPLIAGLLPTSSRLRSATPARPLRAGMLMRGRRIAARSIWLGNAEEHLWTGTQKKPLSEPRGRTRSTNLESLKCGVDLSLNKLAHQRDRK